MGCHLLFGGVFFVEFSRKKEPGSGEETFFLNRLVFCESLGFWRSGGEVLDLSHGAFSETLNIHGICCGLQR